MSIQPGRDHEFIKYLQDFAAERDRSGPGASKARAALAALRRGLGKEPGEALEMYRYIVFWTQNATHAREEAYYLIAALFAAHGLSWPAIGDEDAPERTNLGASLARLAAGKTGSDSVEKRFMALLNCARADVPDHLRRVVALLKAHDIPIDWLRLLHDIMNWDRDDRCVQRAWARAFWGSSTAPAQPAPEPATAALVTPLSDA